MSAIPPPGQKRLLLVEVDHRELGGAFGERTLGIDRSVLCGEVEIADGISNVELLDKVRLLADGKEEAGKPKEKHGEEENNILKERILLVFVRIDDGESEGEADEEIDGGN